MARALGATRGRAGATRSCAGAAASSNAASAPASTRRWHVVANAIDVESVPVRRGSGASERPPPPRLWRCIPLVVCVGRLCRQKGQDVLLDAWPAVRAAVPTARLVLVGDGPDRPHIEQRRLTGVHLAGHHDDVRPWLWAADVAVQPSRYETMALSMLEAMATGRSVVAADIEGAREALGPATARRPARWSPPTTPPGWRSA